MKSILVALLLIPSTARALWFDWTPTTPNAGIGHIDLDETRTNTAGILMPDGVMDFYFAFDGREFTTLDRMERVSGSFWMDRLTARMFSATLAAANGDAIFNCSINDYHIPGENAVASLFYDGETHIVGAGQWAMQVPDSGGTAGLLALAGVGLALARCRHRLIRNNPAFLQRS